MQYILAWYIYIEVTNNMPLSFKCCPIFTRQPLKLDNTSLTIIVLNAIKWGKCQRRTFCYVCVSRFWFLSSSKLVKLIRYLLQILKWHEIAYTSMLSTYSLFVLLSQNCWVYSNWNSGVYYTLYLKRQMSNT